MNKVLAVAFWVVIVLVAFKRKNDPPSDHSEKSVPERALKKFTVDPRLEIKNSAELEDLRNNHRNGKHLERYTASISIGDLKEILSKYDDCLKDSDTMVLYFGAYRKKDANHPHKLNPGDLLRNTIKKGPLNSSLERELVNTPNVFLGFKTADSCSNFSKRNFTFLSKSVWDAFTICPPPTGSCIN